MGEVFIMRGSNMGKTDARTMARCIDEYGPPPTAMLLQEFFKRHSEPRSVGVCDVCGCAHHSHLGHLCNSCFDGMRGVHMAQMHERMMAAFQRMSEAASACGVSFRRATDSMGRIMLHVEGVDPYYVGANAGVISVNTAWSTAVPDPIGDIERGINSLYGKMGFPPIQVFDEICPMPAMPKLNLSSIYGRFGWDERKRPTNAKELMEQRNARPRGPAKRGEWWR